jgi:hypothetical protein
MVEMIGRARKSLADAIGTTFAEELTRYEQLVPSGQSLRELASSLRTSATEVTALHPPVPLDGAQVAEPEPTTGGGSGSAPDRGSSRDEVRARADAPR